MKKYLILFAMALPCLCFCQRKNVPSFGKIDIADLKATSCAYEKDAEAEEIFNVGGYNLDFSVVNTLEELTRHVRIKILSEKGFRFANIKIPYRSYHNGENITNIVASTYNLDAAGNMVVTKLDKNLIYDRRIDVAHSQKVFTLPDVKVGSIIEYKYTVNNPGLVNWYLQQPIPVRYTSFKVDVPSIFEIYLRPICSLPFESKDVSTTQRTIKTFAMSNVPALTPESYMTCYDDYRQRIETWPVAATVDGIRHQLLKTWTEKTQKILEDESFGTQLKKSIPRTADLDLLLQNVSDSVRRMRIIYDYVRKNMTWDGEQTFFASTGVKAAWKEKKGTSGEINLILINLLKDAGLKAYPAMVSTHDNGAVSAAFPDFSQFNNVLALVKANGKEFVLDATSKYTPADLIPENVMNTEALVIDPSNTNGYYWTVLWNDNKLLKDVVVVSGEINQGGQLTGHVSVSSRDYSRVARVQTYQLGKDEYIKRYCKGAADDISVENMALEGMDTDTLPLTQNFDFHAPVTQSGDYAYFSANLFTGMEKNPFVSEERYTDVFFGTNQSHMIVANIKIPDGYDFDALPKSVRMTMEDKSLTVTRMVSAEGGVLHTQIILDYKRPYYTIAEYPILREFYKKMYALLDEQFVIKKKA